MLTVGVLVGVALCLAARLAILQTLDTEAYRARAKDQHEGKIVVEGPRGTISDRNGRELAVSIQTTSIFVRPCALTSTAQKDAIARGVAGALGVPAREIRALIDANATHTFLYLRRRVSPREAKAIQDLKLPGVGFMDDTRRFYPRGHLASHVLGFVDIDGKGQAGIERTFDSTVRGEPTAFISLVDARQRPLLLRATALGRPGRDVSLTIDEFIQYLADTELDRAMEETGSKAGSVIVMDPHSGEILALANRPGFDPNAPGAAPGKSRENLAVSYGYEPGSTFKLITASAAIEERRVRPDDLFDCGMGSITLYGRRIGDHHPYATLSLTQIIAKSSNVGIIRVGQRIPERTFCDYVGRYGFGARTGITLPSEAPGVLQTPGGRTWSGLSQAMMSMGQSIVVTPLQMLTAVCAIATGGERCAPRIVQAITTVDGVPQTLPTRAPVRVISRDTARAITRMMEEVVESGTGKAAAIPGYRVAGKTGTAQKVVGGVYSHSAHISSFVGFAPSMDPAIAAIVVLDEPVGMYYGGDVAAPTFNRIIGPALAYLRIPPTEPVPGAANPRDVLRTRAEARTRDARVMKTSFSRKDPGGRARAAGRDGEPAERDPRPLPAPWPTAASAAPGTAPDLYGAPLRDALIALTRSGCATRTTGSGFVTAQTPPPGTPLAPGATCTLTLALDPPAVDPGAPEGM